MVILGISALYHDSAAAVIRDGEVIAAAQEERFTRVKFDRSIPVNAIDYCLAEAGGLAGKDLDAVVYYDDPVLSLHRYLAGLKAAGDDTEDYINQFEAEMFGKKLWIEKLLRDRLGALGRSDCLYTAKHHLSHAASAFYPSPFDRAAILTLDGVGEWNTTTLGRGCGNRIDLLKKIDYPHSLGLLYSAFTWFCGFRVNFGDYKLMGLAPYGEPVYRDLIQRELIDVKKDGSFRLNLRYFDFQYGRAMVNDAFADLFSGPRRMPEAPITKRERDLAASVQAVTEDIIRRLAQTVKDLTGEENLVLAGGVALNCVANGLLRRDGLFRDIWVQPAAGDSGGALGAALAYYYADGKHPRTPELPDGQKGSFLGPSFSDSEIRSFLEKRNLPFHEFSDSDRHAAIAKLLDGQKVIGLFSGRMEYGPRALGHRSILADPRSEQMQSRLNLSIKYRESFRPFAPAVLAERCGDYFDPGCASGGASNARPQGQRFESAFDSPYMLFCMQVKDKEDEAFDLQKALSQNDDLIAVVNRRRSPLPAVTHVDHSARVQTVDRVRNPEFYDIIKAFEARTGCPVVINTSFNVRGEPIVCTPEDAYKCFMNTEMDVLVLGSFLLYKEEQPESEKRKDRYEPD